MALLFIRPVLGLRTQVTTTLRPALCKATDKGFDSKILAASLTSMHGQKAERKKPFPYKQKDYRLWHLPFDRVDSRLDDNSKIIVIDGNLATGKTELGMKIAKEFDMHYVPDVSDSSVYIKGDLKVDIREFDDQLPVKARSCDFERFYLQNGSKELLKNFSRTQYNLFREKVYNYAYNVISHLLNTGQGVVMNRGMWSDMVFANALRKNGYMSPNALKAYQYQYDVLTIQEWWRPHLIIYLDAPVDLVKKNIQKRNLPWEVKSPVLNDDFLASINEMYKTKYLPLMRPYTEILTYDLAENPELDFEIVVEDLETLNLDTPPEGMEKRFEDWTRVHNREYNHLRSVCSPINVHMIQEMFGFDKPYEAPELVLSGDDMLAYQNIVQEDPRIKYAAKHQPENSGRYFSLF